MVSSFTDEVSTLGDTPVEVPPPLVAAAPPLDAADPAVPADDPVVALLPLELLLHPARMSVPLATIAAVSCQRLRCSQPLLLLKTFTGSGSSSVRRMLMVDSHADQELVDSR
jgi:hypothetical protein